MILEWFDDHGRHDLPWQHDQTAYRVWVSEIMLQQTQVSTVIPYYQRFMGSFPTVEALAAAPLDEVLHLWTGLGYYARARNLHKSAQRVVSEFDGEFPVSLELLESLPGIGRSTAGAILALALNRRGVILDGNVKRVLCRYYAISEWPGNSKTLAQLWELADASTPAQRFGDYAQAMMDLGATLCTRSRPACLHCPLVKHCQARQQGIESQIPASKPRQPLPEKSVYMIMWQDADGRIFLQQRPASGIWGGLWSFPECEDRDSLDQWLHDRQLQIGSIWPKVSHTFSHFRLHITPVHVTGSIDAGQPGRGVADSAGIIWYHSQTQTPQVGLAAPVKKLLQQLT
ncbi:MAG: A/G-specific adenine glycosylase [Pseudomonadota bacterium]|nr:A/G-specific adenine glycosylase [Pseudomonadota bacterium]